MRACARTDARHHVPVRARVRCPRVLITRYGGVSPAGGDELEDAVSDVEEAPKSKKKKKAKKSSRESRSSKRQRPVREVRFSRTFQCTSFFIRRFRRVRIDPVKRSVHPTTTTTRLLGAH